MPGNPAELPGWSQNCAQGTASAAACRPAGTEGERHTLLTVLRLHAINKTCSHLHSIKPLKPVASNVEDLQPGERLQPLQADQVVGGQIQLCEALQTRAAIQADNAVAMQTQCCDLTAIWALQFLDLQQACEASCNPRDPLRGHARHHLALTLMGLEQTLLSTWRPGLLQFFRGVSRMQAAVSILLENMCLTGLSPQHLLSKVRHSRCI